ncbi:hypothetical protein [Chryseobacterium gotjawalense]|uniref:hypothetical protein n=1 Tax=Chryseobacterium gotjawalense TaxID=3042315 RepID=UPI0037BEA220
MGTLFLQNQLDKTAIAKEQELVLRNWSYYELQTKIKYKAEKAGIELIIGSLKKNTEGACKPAG